MSFHSLTPDAYADTAETALLTCLEQNIETNGSLEPQVDTILRMLVDFYSARKRYSDAERFLNQRLKIIQAVDGITNYEESRTSEQVAELRYLSGDRRAALDLLNKAAKLNRPEYARLALDCAALYLEIGDKGRATNIIHSVASAFRKHGAGGAPLSQCFAQCCYLLRKSGQIAELEKMNEQYDTAVRTLGREQYGRDYHGSLSSPDYRRLDGQWMRITFESTNAKEDEENRRLFDAATDYGTVRIHSLQALEEKRKKAAG